VFSASPVAFQSSTFPGVVYKDLPHEARSHGYEMRAVLQSGRLASQESNVSLMNQCGALQGVSRPLGLQLVVREAPQLFVDQRNHDAQSFFVALPPVLQKLGELTGLIFGHGSRVPSRSGSPAYYASARQSSPSISCKTESDLARPNYFLGR
jgi:hypothetical protein